jgi:hypothetical protein
MIMVQSDNSHDSFVINRKGGSLMQNQTLEERIQLLEDVEEIRKLQATYGHYSDKGWNDKSMYCNRIGELFTEDATWECEFLGISIKGREEIIQTFEDMDKAFEFYMHGFSNPIININQNRAKAKWLLYLGGTSGEKVNLTYGSYDNEYARTSGGWLIQAIRLHVSKVLEA